MFALCETMTKEAAFCFYARPNCGCWAQVDSFRVISYLNQVFWSVFVAFCFSVPLILTSLCCSGGWATSTQSFRDSSLSWRRAIILAMRPGVETAATEPSTCFPSDPLSVPWVLPHSLLFSICIYKNAPPHSFEYSAYVEIISFWF